MVLSLHPNFRNLTVILIKDLKMVVMIMQNVIQIKSQM